jgi:uncharacterized protein (TIGR03437 family)
MLIRAFFGACFCVSLAHAQTLPTLSATPSALTFTYQIGATTLPAAQNIAIKRSGSGAALDFTVTVQPAAPWLIVTPLSGKTGTSTSIRVNPASLTAGTYSASLQIDAVGVMAPALASVVLLVKNPPPTMTVAPSTLSFSFRTDSVTMPPPQTFTISTDGEPLSFTAVASGGSWLSISPSLGIAVAGSPITITASVDTTGLVPASNTGRVTITSSNASNKTASVAVTLTVTPGTAVLQSIWPRMAPVGSNDINITIRGSHLFKQSLVYAGNVSLTATWISTSVMLATIPKAQMATQGSLNIMVTNSPQPASNAIAFTVTPPGPQIETVVNSASFAAGVNPTISPGEIISVFGSALGPATAILATPTNGVYPTSLGSPATIVEFEYPSGTWNAAPLIMTQANQINLISPFALPPSTPPAQVNLRVTYNALVSAPYPFDAVDAHPGVFTLDSSGSGQAAALNWDETKQIATLNSASNPAPKGSSIIVFLTGAGTLSPAVPDGQVIPASSPTTPLPVLSGTVSVTINGEAASVESQTAVEGSVAGLAKLVITVPTTVKPGKDLALMVTVNGKPSPLSATVSVK